MFKTNFEAPKSFKPYLKSHDMNHASTGTCHAQTRMKKMCAFENKNAAFDLRIIKIALPNKTATAHPEGMLILDSLPKTGFSYRHPQKTAKQHIV